jgi:hypothetical protein
MGFGAPDCLALPPETTLELEVPSGHPPHHFWDLRTARLPYQRSVRHALAADMHSGHHGRSTACLEARAMYRADGLHGMALPWTRRLRVGLLMVGLTAGQV